MQTAVSNRRSLGCSSQPVVDRVAQTFLRQLFSYDQIQIAGVELTQVPEEVGCGFSQIPPIAEPSDFNEARILFGLPGKEPATLVRRRFGGCCVFDKDQWSLRCVMGWKLTGCFRERRAIDDSDFAELCKLFLSYWAAPQHFDAVVAQ